MPLRGYRGKLDATEMELLQRVFDRLCTLRKVDEHDREKREALASELIDVFLKGGEGELLRLLLRG